MTQNSYLEWAKLTADIVKWVIAGIAAAVSFYVIDLGKLKVEEFRARAENQRILLQAYLNATESVQPDIWKRKLRVLETYSEDKRIRDWAGAELDYVERYAAQDALYRETLKVASQLAYRSKGKTDVKWEAARSRFEQLYWADLPYAKESSAVAKAMIDFRKVLLAAETTPNNPIVWDNLDVSLLSLSGALRESQPVMPPQASQKPY